MTDFIVDYKNEFYKNKLFNKISGFPIINTLK